MCLQIGGKFFYPDIDPSDSITVIEVVHHGEYRQYSFILHDRHSRGHRLFEPQMLDSTYKANEAYFYGDNTQTTAIRPAFVTPASAVHNFEIIEYVNSSGELI